MPRHPIIAALLYLRIHSVANWIISRVKRLRQPKYLFGAIVGGAYLWLVLFRRLFATTGPAMAMPGFPSFPAELQPMVTSLAAIALLLVVLLLGWILPSEKPGLAFSEAEVAFLFPAPATRRMLIHYKLLSSQFGILLTTLFFTFASNRWSFVGGNMATRAIGWWLILSTLKLHFMGAALTISRLMDSGLDVRGRRLRTLGVVAGLLALAALVVWRQIRAPRVEDFLNFRTFANYLQPIMTTGLVPWLLLPAKLLLAPFLAHDLRTFALAIGPALLVLAGHYVWVLRAETPFEEASIAAAERRTARIAAARSGNYRLGRTRTKARRGPFVLASSGGRPELAFLWKNLLSTRPYLNHRTALVVAAVIIVGSSWLSHGTEVQKFILGFAGMFALIFGGYALAFGPQFARQDLRSDMPNIDILKTYPLPGWQVILGELLTPVAILSAVLWLVLLMAGLGLGSTRHPTFTPELRATTAICAALLVPPVCMLQLIVPNAATLLFPSWAQTTRVRGGGIDVMGQRLIFVAGQVVVVLLAILPAALVGLVLWFAVYYVLQVLENAGGTTVAVTATTVASVSALAVLLTEVCLALRWLGHRFERFDLSVENVR
jgi:ABC-2 type transport system permease protein